MKKALNVSKEFLEQAYDVLQLLIGKGTEIIELRYFPREGIQSAFILYSPLDKLTLHNMRISKYEYSGTYLVEFIARDSYPGATYIETSAVKVMELLESLNLFGMPYRPHSEPSEAH